MFIEVPDVLVPIIDILPSTQTNSAIEDGEIAQENHSPSEMFQDSKKSKNNFRSECFAFMNKIESKSATKNFQTPRKKIGKGERSFLPSWYDKWT